jgi:uncharacterized membrane protein YhaH (DUF805 family)
MGFGTAVSTCFSKYATFQGRAKRSEFWWFGLFCMVVMIAISVLGGVLMDDPTIPLALVGVFSLAIILPGLAVTVRRLHDGDRSGWWYFIQLVPMIGGLWFLYLMVAKGTPGPNRFGE